MTNLLQRCMILSSPLLLLLLLTTHQTTVIEAAKPIGIHIDIEPHSLADEGWDNNGGPATISLANQWLDLLEKIMAKTQDTNIPVTIDIAKAYSSVVQIPRNGITKSLADHAMDIVDNVVLMAYRDFFDELADCDGTNHKNCDKANSLKEIVQQLLDVVTNGGHSGKTVQFGVETNPDVGDKVTFGEEGEAFMEQQLDKSAQHFKDDSTFEGIYVHDFTWATVDSFTDDSLRDTASDRTCRSMWMWTDKYVLSKEGKTPQDLVPILHSHSVDNIAVASEWFFLELKPQFVNFINTMGDNGITVELLLANHRWALEVNHPIIMGLVEDAVELITNMNGSVTSAGQCQPLRSTTPPKTCGSDIGKPGVIRTFCEGAGRVNENSKHAQFYELDEKNKKKVLDYECEGQACTAEECCKIGRKRMCKNTNKRGEKQKFKQNQCKKGWKLDKKKKNKPCTAENGLICTNSNCCKKKKN